MIAMIAIIQFITIVTISAVLSIIAIVVIIAITTLTAINTMIMAKLTLSLAFLSLFPRMPRDTPTRPRYYTKMAHKGDKTAQHGPRWLQDGQPDMAPSGSKMAQERPKDGPEMALRRTKIAQDGQR